LSRREARALEIAAEAAWDEKLERERAITKMILDEFASAEKLSDERKSEIARKAAKARWAKKRQQEESE